MQSSCIDIDLYTRMRVQKDPTVVLHKRQRIEQSHLPVAQVKLHYDSYPMIAFIKYHSVLSLSIEEIKARVVKDHNDE